MSHESEELSTQPLAALMKSAGSSALSAPIITTSRGKLRAEVIDIHRLKDVGRAQAVSLIILFGICTDEAVVNQSSITSLSFHPTYPLLLSSGPSSRISLYHISSQTPNPNSLLTDLMLRSTPLTTSAFLLPSGNKVFLSGRRRYFHVWDLKNGTIERVSRIIGQEEIQRSMERFKLSPCGRWMGLVGSGRKGGGYVNILDAHTCQWVAQVRVEGNGGVADFAWWRDGEGMLVIGKGGEAVEWDGRRKSAVARWIDEGAVGITVVTLGGSETGPMHLGGSRWAAVGSSSGIVNVYDRRQWVDGESVPAHPKPVRIFDQLTTPISQIELSPDGQILCMACRWKRDALRLVHLPSCTVYKNWPTNSTPLGRITALAWSINSKMLAVANEQGKIRLWEIKD